MTNQSLVINDSSLIADALTGAVATENQNFALLVISHPTHVEEWKDVYVGTNLAEKILVQSPNPGVKSNLFLRTATVHAGGGDDFVLGSDFTDVLLETMARIISSTEMAMMSSMEEMATMF